VYFFIYWDGVRLRGYATYNGNLWNKSTNTAYGDDEEADPKDLFSIYGTKNTDHLSYSPELMVREILSVFYKK
jgi:hypothetical protein